VITDDLSAMERRIACIAQAPDGDANVADVVAGIHVEGPFINPAPGYVGAHPAAHVSHPDPDQAMRLVDAGRGRVRLVTLAPELDGADETIRRLTSEGIRVAAGHSDASRDDLRRAIDAGLGLFTHLGNGCPAQLHRHDNIVQRVLSLADQLYVSFIADSHHVPLFALANYLHSIPDHRVIIVTDAISAAGLGPGTYSLAGQTVHVGEDLAAWAESREHFAGCATTMPQMERILTERTSIPAAHLRRWMVDNPKRFLGIGDAA